MKKILLTIATAALCSTAFAAEPTVLYERTADTWTDADLAEWVNDNAQYVTQTIDGGLKMTGTNSGWNSTKEVTYTENSIVTLTATLNGGAATGRAGSYDFIQLGDAKVCLDGQNKKAFVMIGETETALSGFTRSGDYMISMTVNQASKELTVTVSGGAKGEATGKIAGNLPNNVIVGHYKAGKEGYEITEILKDIKVTEEIQEVAIATYTINYLFNGSTIKSETGEMAVGSEITATSPLTIDGQKYYFADGATTSMIIEAGIENVLNIDMREAYIYSYTVSNNVNSDVKTGDCVEGESATVPFSRYILDEKGNVWKKDANKTNPWYGITFTPTSNNYTETLVYSEDLSDGIYFVEGEYIEGMTETAEANADIRCSNAAGGYADEVVDIYTLKPGSYKVTIGVWGNTGATFTVKAGEEVVLTAETKGYWNEVVSEEFTLTEETTLTFEGANSSKPLDYVLITGTVDTGSAVKGVEVAEDNVWYNLQGVKIAEPTQKGLFIHNGKKVIVK